MRNIVVGRVRRANAIVITCLQMLGLIATSPTAADWYGLGKLTATDAAADDFLGWSIGLSGRSGVIGAPFDDENGNDSGSVYLYDLYNGVWFGPGFEQGKLIPSDGAANDWFGFSAAISGNRAIIGSVLDDDDGNQSGSAYLFDVTSGTELWKLTASDAAAEDNFGHAVGISGNRAIVGSLYDDDDGNRSGSAYLFDVPSGTQLSKLNASDAAAEDLFGGFRRHQWK